MLFIILWPLGVPLVISVLLFASRTPILHQRKSALFRATAFLHSEYVTEWFWWEVVALTHRIIVTGWVSLIEQACR